jgi:hypothetical protein
MQKYENMEFKDRKVPLLPTAWIISCFSYSVVLRDFKPSDVPKWDPVRDKVSIE